MGILTQSEEKGFSKLSSDCRIFLPDAGPFLTVFRAPEGCLYLLPTEVYEERLSFPGLTPEEQALLEEPVHISRNGGWFALPLAHCENAGLDGATAAVLVPKGTGWVLAHWSRWSEVEQHAAEERETWEGDCRAYSIDTLIGVGWGPGCWVRKAA